MAALRKKTILRRLEGESWTLLDRCGLRILCDQFSTEGKSTLIVDAELEYNQLVIYFGFNAFERRVISQ